MSGKDPKETDSKIKFFKIDPEGDIAPAFPKDGEPFAPLELEDPSRSQPNFPPLEPENISSIPNINAAFEAGAPVEGQIEEQIHILKPQVEDISNGNHENLTTDQAEVLKKYITLKETEVRDLKDQHRQYESFLKKVTSQLEQHARRNREVLVEVETLKRREENVRTELREMKDKHHAELQTLKNDYEERLHRSGNMEVQAEEFVRRKEEWREKLREDLKRIKLKERELENKYELLKRDTQALLDSKDKHVLELKKKNDALELELETLEERLRRGNTVLGSIDSKKRRLVETMKLAISLLEEIDRADASAESSEDDRKVG